MLKKVIMLMLCMSMVGSVVWSQEASSSENETITVKKSDLPPAVLEKIETSNKIRQYGEWIGLGKEIGQATREGLSALTNESNKFAHTSVGKFVMFIIAWKVIGNQALRIIITLPILLFVTVIFVWAFKKHCMPFKVITEVKGSDGTVTKTVSRTCLHSKDDHFNDKTADWTLGIGLLYLACLGASLMIMLIP